MLRSAESAQVREESASFWCGVPVEVAVGPVIRAIERTVGDVYDRDEFDA